MSQSHSAEQLEKGRPFGLFETSTCCKISKNLKWDPLETKKIRKKVAQCRKNSNPIVSSCFVSYNKNGVTERGPLKKGNRAYPNKSPRKVDTLLLNSHRTRWYHRSNQRKQRTTHQKISNTLLKHRERKTKSKSNIFEKT